MLNIYKQSMWAHNPIFFSVNIFSLWSNYILYCFIIAENLPGHDPAHITSLHQILAHLIYPISLNIFPNFLFSGEHCEGSTIFIYPNGMKFVQFLHMTRLPSSSKLQLNPIIYVSPASISIFWPDWHIAKQVLSRPLLLPSNFLGSLSYPNIWHMPIFSYICLVNIPQQIS